MSTTVLIRSELADRSRQDRSGQDSSDKDKASPNEMKSMADLRVCNLENEVKEIREYMTSLMVIRYRTRGKVYEKKLNLSNGCKCI